MPGQNNINLPNTLSPISLSHQSSPLKDFSNMRIIQKNIVYVIGLTASLANQEVLSSFNFFGQYGIILNKDMEKSMRYPRTSIEFWFDDEKVRDKHYSKIISRLKEAGYRFMEA